MIKYTVKVHTSKKIEKRTTLCNCHEFEAYGVDSHSALKQALNFIVYASELQNAHHIDIKLV